MFIEDQSAGSSVIILTWDCGHCLRGCHLSLLNWCGKCILEPDQQVRLSKINLLLMVVYGPQFLN